MSDAEKVNAGQPAAETREQGTILVERQDDVATVMLNRPDKRNALDLRSWAMLGEAVRQLGADDDVRCIIVRGAGDDFGSGADIAEFSRERGNFAQARMYGQAVHDAMRNVLTCPHPTVAMIRGACIGGGLEIALCCDIRIAAESSRFGIPVNRLGLTMAYGELRTLLYIVPRSVALEMLLEGQVFEARRAWEMGLVNRIVPDADIEKEAAETARRIADGAPLVNRWHKKFVRRLADPSTLTRGEIEEGYACFGTHDFQTGVKAFLEKKKPEFEGR